MSDLVIRRADPADAPALTRVAHLAKRHWGYADELMALWARDLTPTPAFVEAHPVYCGLAGTEIAGFHALSRDGATFELEHMWVRPAHMGAGVGARLFHHAVALARRLGGASLEIVSDPHAEGFYLRMGAGRVGVVASTPPGRELPLLVLDLTAARE